MAKNLFLLSWSPVGYTAPKERTKPWGTSHAVLCAADNPFVVGEMIQEGNIQTDFGNNAGINTDS